MRCSFAISVVLVILACGKDERDGSASAPSLPCGPFIGVHWRDANAQPYGESVDTTDWTWKDTWCEAAEALFADRPPVTLDTLPPDSLSIYCFANPVYWQFFFQVYFARDDTSYVDVRIVDERFALLYSADSVTGSACWIVRDTLPVSTGSMVRAYYRIVHADGSAHRGHGDVLINN